MGAFSSDRQRWTPYLSDRRQLARRAAPEGNESTPTVGPGTGSRWGAGPFRLPSLPWRMAAGESSARRRCPGRGGAGRGGSGGARRRHRRRFGPVVRGGDRRAAGAMPGARAGDPAAAAADAARRPAAAYRRRCGPGHVGPGRSARLAAAAGGDRDLMVGRRPRHGRGAGRVRPARGGHAGERAEAPAGRHRAGQARPPAGRHRDAEGPGVRAGQLRGGSAGGRPIPGRDAVARVAAQLGQRRRERAGPGGWWRCGPARHHAGDEPAGTPAGRLPDPRGHAVGPGRARAGDQRVRPGADRARLFRPGRLPAVRGDRPDAGSRAAAGGREGVPDPESEPVPLPLPGSPGRQDRLHDPGTAHVRRCRAAQRSPPGGHAAGRGGQTPARMAAGRRVARLGVRVAQGRVGRPPRRTRRGDPDALGAERPRGLRRLIGGIRRRSRPAVVGR